MRCVAGLLVRSTCVVALSMVLPIVIVAGQEAIKAVPGYLRDASYGLGATQWTTIRRIVLPNSVSGILTGIILQVSRAAGETAPIMFTGAVFYKAVPEGDLLAYGLFDQCMALSMHLFTISTQVPNIPLELSFATALVLVGLVFLMNLVSIFLRAHYRKKRLW